VLVRIHGMSMEPRLHRWIASVISYLAMTGIVDYIILYLKPFIDECFVFIWSFICIGGLLRFTRNDKHFPLLCHIHILIASRECCMAIEPYKLGCSLYRGILCNFSVKKESAYLQILFSLDFEFNLSNLCS